MPLLIMLIVGIFNLVLSGVWLGSIFIDKSYNMPVSWHQYVWAAFCFCLGIYLLIACIGHVAVVK